VKLRIITGRAGAGKSKLVLETIAAQRFERPQILLVPEHATGSLPRAGGYRQP